MQRLSGTIRLFQMPALMRLSFFFLVAFGVLLGCSEDPNASVEKGQEVAAKVNKKEFQTIELKGYRFEAYKKMSKSGKDAREIFSASYLPKEYHLAISRIPLSSFRADPDFPAAKNKQLEWFAKQYAQKLQERLISLKGLSTSNVFVGEQRCFKVELSGRAFGFPKEKHYFLRFYRFEKEFIAIEGWTTVEFAKEFEPIVQYMGMTFSLVNH